MRCSQAQCSCFTCQVARTFRAGFEKPKVHMEDVGLDVCILWYMASLCLLVPTIEDVGFLYASLLRPQHFYWTTDYYLINSPKLKNSNSNRYQMVINSGQLKKVTVISLSKFSPRSCPLTFLPQKPGLFYQPWHSDPAQTWNKEVVMWFCFIWNLHNRQHKVDNKLIDTRSQNFTRTDVPPTWMNRRHANNHTMSTSIVFYAVIVPVTSVLVLWIQWCMTNVLNQKQGFGRQ